MLINWSRTHGYECSSKGDTRFSAFHARLQDGRSIEQHYQCDIKGYDIGGQNWRLGKGKPPLNPSTDTWNAYKNLWKQYLKLNPTLTTELRQKAAQNGNCLKDRFANTPINQARALAEILNETTQENPPGK
jgi:hypothetical protein